MRTIGVVTVGRSDYGIYLPILKRIRQDKDLHLQLIVSGAHLSPEFGRTIEQIKADGFPIAERVEMLLSSDSPEGIAKSMGMGIIGFSQVYARTRPDILLVLGDRFEMHAAALAALPFKIPVAHIHGGEVTQGAIDDALRHSLTKLSHLHFVSTQEYARRVIQMGEEPWRVIVSGAPSLDNLKAVQLLSRAEMEARFGLRLSEEPFLLVTFHPVTLEFEHTRSHTEELLAALEMSGLPVIFTMPNADTQGRLIRAMISEYVQMHPNAQAVESLGTQGYFSLMAQAAAMVGNSSSGIIEAPSFKLPVVNVGNRQKGRVRGANVIDCKNNRKTILSAIQTATSPQFREKLNGLQNPYGKGNASQIIIASLKETALDETLITKHFHLVGS